MLLRYPVALRHPARGPLRGRVLGVALAFGLAAAIASPAAEPKASASSAGQLDRRNALQAEINHLRKELRLRERALAEIDRPAAASVERMASPQAVGSRVLRNYSSTTPTSSLDRAAAFRTAILATQFTPGAKISAVAGTGSMEPVFGRDAYLLMEPAPFDALQEGDIVTYRVPGSDHPVVHRLVRKFGGKFVAKGDNNARADSTYVTRENYLMRVFGVVYTQPAASDPHAPLDATRTAVATAPAPPPGSGIAVAAQK